jgi:hypothetical protein
MAIMVVVRMSDAPAMRRAGADNELKKAGSIEPIKPVTPGLQKVSANIAVRALHFD